MHTVLLDGRLSIHHEGSSPGDVISGRMLAISFLNNETS
jgi:hypothetical protein